MKRIGIHKFMMALPILAIVLLASVFHFQIYIENVLSLRPAEDFGVEIALLRIIFEPFLGLLLFFNRSIYALEELPLALLWVIILYLGFGVVRVLRIRSGKKEAVLGLLANVPLLVGICFTVFIAILFLPLPNNTIVNNSKDAILVTTHAHTEFSHDGLISQKALWKWHRRNGFDAFFITDHAGHAKSLQFAQSQKKGTFPMDPLVMVGQEYSASNHMSLLGLNANFETKGMSDKTVINTVHERGGAVIINHWFDGKGEAKELYKELGADGFEIENAGKDLYYNRQLFDEIKIFCREYGLVMVGGLDFHGYGRVCSLYNSFEIPNWNTLDSSSKEVAILEILRNGHQEKIKVLMYKDRPFYTKNHLVFRPFLTLVNYFRTLNAWQVLSWVFWLLFVQFLVNRVKWPLMKDGKGLTIFAALAGMLPIILGIIYYRREESVMGYNEIYSEYSALLGPIGGIFFSYAFAVWYFRTFCKRKVYFE